LKIERYPENPLVTPKDVPPTFDRWEILCAFNAGVIEYGDEIIMLMRVAERPMSPDPEQVFVPVLECTGDQPRLKTPEY